MTLGSLFDGIGGWLLASRHAGVTPVWSSEIEAFPCAVTKRHFPEVKQLGDITQLNGAEIPPVDIVCAGSPCQDLSIAGARKGLDGARSGLFRVAVGLIRDMRRATCGRYPRFFVWENVLGAFSSNKGMDFRAVLEEIAEAEIPMPRSGRWADAGMVRSRVCEVAWRVLDAQYWGVPQRRRRIFLVADFAADGRCAGEILLDAESVPRNPAACERTREGTAGEAEGSARTASGVYGFDTRASIASSAPVIADGVPPITTSNRLGTMAAGFIGKAAPTAGNIGYAEEIAPTLMAEKPQHVAIYDMTHADEVMRPVKEGTTPTLNARMGTGGNQVPVIHCVGNGQLNQIHLQAKVGALNCTHDQQCVLTQSTVRRLTPLECERLQGLPDGYTEGGSDTARYKALGNGMAQPCAMYIIKRIVEVVSNGRMEKCSD